MIANKVNIISDEPAVTFALVVALAAFLTPLVCNILAFLGLITQVAITVFCPNIVICIENPYNPNC